MFPSTTSPTFEQRHKAYTVTGLSNDYPIKYVNWNGDHVGVTQAEIDSSIQELLQGRPEEDEESEETSRTVVPFRPELAPFPDDSFQRQVLLAATQVVVNKSRCDVAGTQEQAKLWAARFLVVFQRLRVDRALGPELRRDLAVLVYRFIEKKYNKRPMKGGKYID